MRETYIIDNTFQATAPNTWYHQKSGYNSGSTFDYADITANTDLTIDKHGVRHELATYNQERNASSSSYAENRSGDAIEADIHLFNPPTASSVVPGGTNSNGTFPAYTTQWDRSYSWGTDTVSTLTDNKNETYGDTSVSYNYASRSGKTNKLATHDSAITSTSSITTASYSTSYSTQRTGKGAAIRISTRDDTIAYESFVVTTNTTFSKYATEQVDLGSGNTTWSVTVSTESGTQNITSWDSSRPITYREDIFTYKTSVGSTGTSTGISYVSSDTLTTHAFDKLYDTVLLLHGGRIQADYNLGDMLWSVADTNFAIDGSYVGRMSEIYKSFGAVTHTVKGFKMWRTESVECTAITVSRNTKNTTVSVATGTGTNTGTAVTTAIGYATSKNGIPWEPYETYQSGTSTGQSAHSSLSKTDSYYYGVDGVESTIRTYTQKEDTKTVTKSSTIFTHSVQETGYSNNTEWTSQTTSAEFASTSFSEVRAAILKSVSTTMDFISRSTMTQEILIASHATQAVSDYTSTIFFGFVKRTTTAVIWSYTTTTRSSYDARFNPEIQQWTTRSTVSGGTSNNAFNATMSMTYYTEEHLEIMLETVPVGMDNWSYPNIQQNNVARYQVHPFGYAGFGGTYDAPSLIVHSTVSLDMVAGGTFDSSQSLGTYMLPTASAYPNVTFFPVDTEHPILPNGATNGRYLSTVDGIGRASIGITWTATTDTMIDTLATTTTTSKGATYLAQALGAIGGEFFSDDWLTLNTTNGWHLVGGYAAGDNMLGNSYQIRCASGFAKWTEFASTQSNPQLTGESSVTDCALTFSIPANHAIVISIEPIITVRWGINYYNDVPAYFSSTPHLPT